MTWEEKCSSEGRKPKEWVTEGGKGRLVKGKLLIPFSFSWAVTIQRLYFGSRVGIVTKALGLLQSVLDTISGTWISMPYLQGRERFGPQNVPLPYCKLFITIVSCSSLPFSIFSSPQPFFIVCKNT